LVHSGGGLNRFDPEQETFVHYQHNSKDPYSLSNDIIMSIYEDTAGAIWVATYGGIDKYDPGEYQFGYYRSDPGKPEDFSNHKVRSIYQESGGSVWIGTGGGGLNQLSKTRDSIAYYQHDDSDPTSISDNDIWAIDQDKRGDLWIATHGAGLNRFIPSKKTFSHYKHDPDNLDTPACDSLYDLVVDEKRDVLWIAAYLSGLDKFDLKMETFTHYPFNSKISEGIVSNWSTAVTVDTKGIVWVGTEAGLSYFNPETERFTNFKHIMSDPISLSSNMIQAIYEDSQNNVWIGTSDGLNRFDRNSHSFERYSTKDGLAGNYVVGILEDNNGDLWISTGEGLSKFDFHNKTFRNYDQNDGLQGNRFLMHSAFKNKAGELFFGGTNGFNVFNPDKLKDNKNVPEIIFTDFQLFNNSIQAGKSSALTKHINYAQQIILDYNQNVFNIEFTALNYRNSNKNEYAYIMEGFDKTYNYMDGNKRSVSYTNLDPGQYTFRVRGSNNDGVWNKKGASIKIIVSPPWWKTLWFKGLAGVLILLIIWGGLNYIKKLRFEIKQRKIAQNDLKKSEKKFRVLVESQTDLFCRFLPDGRFSFVNEAYCKFFNKIENELIGTNWKPLSVDDDLKIIEEKLSTMSPANPIVIIENRVLSGKSEIHWVQFVNKGLFDHDGKLLEIQSVGRDITERKQAEESLRKAQESLEIRVKERTIELDNANKVLKNEVSDRIEIEKALKQREFQLIETQQVAHIGNWDLDLTTPKLDWSDETFKLFDKDPKNFIPSFDEFAHLVHPNDLETMQTKFNNALESDENPYHAEVRIINDSGREWVMEAFGKVTRDESGKALSIFGTAQDVTEKSLVEALQESELKMRIIAENFPNSYISIIESDYTIGFTSGQEFKKLNIDPEQFVGLSLDQVFGDKAQTIKPYYEKTFGGEECSFEIFINEQYQLYRTVPLYSEAGLIQRILVVVENITHQKKLEVQLQQAQKMESIGNLAGGIAHDFNNLLYPIIGFAEMLKEDLPPDSPEHESAQEIFNAGKRGGELVKQILAFSRQSDHKLQPVRIQKILKEVLKLTRSSIPTDIEIHQEIQQDCGSVMAEATQLHQISMNLITNAYHAVEDTSGIISVQLKEIRMDDGDLNDSPLKPGEYAILSVSDNGPGIPRNVMNNIFEPYFTTKEKGKGTGLGLAVVYGIVKEHNGDIKVYSEEGEGTTFNVYLPLIKKSIEPIVNGRVLVLPTGTERLLLVDDEESVVRLEKQMLERLGYNVDTQSNSIDALEMFKANPNNYDLVVTDMTMPNMTGDKLAKEILSVRPGMPIIICTGFSERINKEQAEGIGVSGFLMKPVVKSEMAQMVRKVLDDIIK